MILEIAGRRVEIEGDERDGYFREAAENVANLRGLADRVARLPDDCTIIDVGANIGLSSILMALTRPSARIIAFEASPANAAYLERNVANFPNVEVIAKAVSDAPGTLLFHEASFAAGSHVVGRSHMAQHFASVPVEAVTLDDFAATRGIVPAFIKIDVEGHEPEVLAGARELLRHPDRPRLMMEFNAWTLNAFAGHSPAAFATALFAAFDIEGFGDPVSLLHTNLVQHRCVTDIAMRPKVGTAVPSLEEMSFSPAARRRLDSLCEPSIGRAGTATPARTGDL